MPPPTPPITLHPRVPTAAELRQLAEAVDWGDHYDWATIDAALAASLHGVVAESKGRAVGVARLVGDGIRYCYVQDVLVHPDFGELGIASSMVEELLDWVDEHAGAQPFVALFSSPDAEGVYETLGFAPPDDMTGMVLRQPRRLSTGPSTRNQR